MVQESILVALIAAATSFFVAIASTIVTIRVDRANRLRAEEREDRQLQRTVETELDAVRIPLREASLALARRINNIREDNFFGYLDGDPRRAEIAVASTLYRFARYWFVVEHLLDQFALYKFQSSREVAAVSSALHEIGRTFASDGYDSGLLMYWQEEQRAVAELMRDPESPLGCCGFATFVTDFDDRFEEWLSEFSLDLREGDHIKSRRLQLVQQQLVDLCRLLDPNGIEASQLKRLERTR